MENREYYRALQEICDDDREWEAIGELFRVAEKKYVQAVKDVVEARAKLYYISEINKTQCHNATIATLCQEQTAIC